MDKNGDQVSDLEDLELHCVDPDLDTDPIFRPSLDSSFSSTLLSNFQMDSVAKNSTLLNDQEDKENFYPPPKTPGSERPTRPPASL